MKAAIVVHHSVAVGGDVYAVSGHVEGAQAHNRGRGVFGGQGLSQMRLLALGTRHVVTQSTSAGLQRASGTVEAMNGRFCVEIGKCR